MLDLMHKMLYMGIGAAAMTEEKAREMVSELEKRGEVSTEEGRKLVDELISKARKQTEDLQKTVANEVNKLAGQGGWPSRDEFEALKQQVAALESRLEQSNGES